MPVKFEIFQSPVNETDGKKKKCHARVVPSGTATTSELAAEICRAASLTEGDVAHAVIELTRQIGEHLASGESVHIDGLGYFNLTLSTPDDCDEKTRAEHISVKSVSFRPDKALRERLKKIRPVRSERKVHSSNLTSEQIDGRLKEYFLTHEAITSSRFMALVGMTPATASRKIRKLLEEGKLFNKGTKYRPYYVAGEKLV